MENDLLQKELKRREEEKIRKQNKKNEPKFRDKNHPVLEFFLKMAKKYVSSDKFQNKYFTPFKVTEIGDGAFMISETYISNAYLFVGTHESLLIDTGYGLSGLRNVVSKITDKPLTVVLTHAHPFVSGGAGEFEKVYVHKNDLKNAKHISNFNINKYIYMILPFKSLFHLEDRGYVKEGTEFVALNKKKTKFDIGGRTIRIIHSPSHTSGSCCFKDSKTGIVVTGHVTSPLSLMIFPSASTMSEYSSVVAKLQNEIGEGENYSAYGLKPLQSTRTADLKELIDDAVVLGNSASFSKLIRVRFSDDKRRVLVYFPAKVIRREFKERVKTMKLYK